MVAKTGSVARGVRALGWLAGVLVLLGSACNGSDKSKAPLEPPGESGGDAGAAGAPPSDDDGSTTTSTTGRDRGLQFQPLGAPCLVDGDCNDGKYCNGIEECPKGVCVRPAQGPCGNFACHEREDGGTGECECENPDAVQEGDWDGDNVRVEGCAEPGADVDCDDSDVHRYPGNTEVCEPEGDADDTHDEDCDPRTDGAVDADHDNHFDARCSNAFFYLTELEQEDPVPFLTKNVLNDDCDDDDPTTSPAEPEICDNKDNNCDGVPDNVLGEDGSAIDPDPKIFYRDADRDGWGAVCGDDDSACVLKTVCNNPPPGYSYQSLDCDDEDYYVNPGKEETCNGKDDDCDDIVDRMPPEQEGELMSGEPQRDDTTYECTPTGEDGASWVITQCPPRRLNCSVADHGTDWCETVDGTLDHCGGCDPADSCTFACQTTATDDDGRPQFACDEIVQLAVGEKHACGVTGLGYAACWGTGTSGQLGTGSTATTGFPTQVVDLDGVSMVTAGESHTCAIAGASRTAYCWGSNAEGQSGNGAASSSVVPVAVLRSTNTLTEVDDIAAGAAHSCAVQSGGSVYCWGQRANGRLGNGLTSEGFSGAVQVLNENHDYFDQAKNVAVGRTFSCALTLTKTVVCWGSNGFGQLGRPDTVTEESPYPLEVPGIANAQAIAAGNAFACAIVDGRVWCWGDNTYRQLGRTDTVDTDVPAPVAGLSGVTAISAGALHVCALTNAGEVWCWGENQYGVLGVDTLTFQMSATPIQVQVNDASQIKSGTSSACAVAAGVTQCWGNNLQRQLGRGNQGPSEDTVPQPVEPLRR